MSETNKAEKHITYDAIKIGLASPEKIREWSRKKMVFSVKRSSDQARTGSVIVVSTRRSVIRVSFVISVV